MECITLRYIAIIIKRFEGANGSHAYQIVLMSSDSMMMKYQPSIWTVYGFVIFLTKPWMFAKHQIE